MRRRAATDENQSDVVSALRKKGAKVVSLHAIGGGVPDLLVGFRQRLYLLEVKDGEKCPSDRQLTPAQEKFHRLWDGYCHVVNNEKEALMAIGAL